MVGKEARLVQDQLVLVSTHFTLLYTTSNEVTTSYAWLLIDMDQSLVLRATLTIEVELVPAMVRRPADRLLRQWSTVRLKRVRLTGEETSPRAIAVLVYGCVELRLAQRLPRLGGITKM